MHIARQVHSGNVKMSLSLGGVQGAFKVPWSISH